jgi:hypothetical protein
VRIVGDNSFSSLSVFWLGATGYLYTDDESRKSVTAGCRFFSEAGGTQPIDEAGIDPVNIGIAVFRPVENRA